MYEQLRIRPAIDVGTGERVWLVVDDEGCVDWFPAVDQAVAKVREIEGDDAPVRIEEEGTVETHRD